MYTYYQMLGIRINAHPAEIDTAYQSILSGCNSLTSKDRDSLYLAHVTLMHPQMRFQYDRTIANGVNPNPYNAFDEQKANLAIFNSKTESNQQNVQNHQYNYYQETPKKNNIATDFFIGYVIGMSLVFVLTVFAIIL